MHFIAKLFHAVFGQKTDAPDIHVPQFRQHAKRRLRELGTSNYGRGMTFAEADARY